MNKHRILLWFIILFMCGHLCAHAEGNTNQSYVTTIFNERNGLPTGEANAVCQTRDHYVWIGSYGGLIRYDGTTFRNYSQEGNFPSSSIRSLEEDNKGRLWIGTNDAGLFLYENNAFTHIPEENAPVFLSIRDMIEDNQGRLWVASTSGLARVENGVLLPVNDSRLYGQIVYSLGVDAHGRIWAALDNWQCAVVSENDVSILTSDAVFPDGQQMYCVSSDAAGNIYIGSYQNAVARLTFHSDSTDTTAFDVSIMNTGDVSIHNTVTVTKDGDILVCGQRGFAWIDPHGHLRTFDETTGAAGLNNAMKDYEGNLWLASASYGVIKYSPGCFQSPNQTAGLDGLAFNTITMDEQHYYLGMDSGLMIYDHNWNPIENDLTRLLQGIRIRHIITDRDGRIWLATYSAHGTICYHPETGIITDFRAENGMEDCWTRTLLERQDGSIAAGTSNGVYIIRDGVIAGHFGTEDGLLNGTILCLAEDKDGTLYIGTDGGYMYTITGNTLTLHGSDEGLEDGIVLRLLPDENGGMFVSAGSSLYYWQDHSFRRLDQFEKAAGNIFDLHLVGGKLYMLQNSGILEIDAGKLLNGEKAETALYSFQHGLTGSLNANTWHLMTDDSKLYIATRSGVSIFAFSGVENPLPDGIIHTVEVDQTVYEHPSSITLPSDARRITISFSVLSYTDTDQSRISYCLEGLDTHETLLEDKKSSSISYTNLPGGDYVFRMKVYHTDKPEEAHEYSLHIHKDKKITEQPIFWFLAVVLSIVALTIIVTAITQLRHRVHVRRMQERQKELQSLLVQSLQSFAKVIDAKDPYTKGHSFRVAYYARELAKRMHMSADEQERIYYIALLHDIGKIGIPDHILNKEGPLTKEEKDIVKTHPQIGGHVLEGFSSLEGIADGARYHHERYDGNGYCEGRKGTDIPLVARIICVADSYDTMSSNRCYRPALPKDKIIKELKENSGTQFDPEIVPFMLAMIEENAIPAK